MLLLGCLVEFPVPLAVMMLWPTAAVGTGAIRVIDKVQDQGGSKANKKRPRDRPMDHPFGLGETQDFGISRTWRLRLRPA